MTRRVLLRYAVAIAGVLAVAAPVIAYSEATASGPNLIPPVVSVQPSPTVQGIISGPSLIPPIVSSSEP